MRRNHGAFMVALAAAVCGYGCGNGDSRPAARAPIPARSASFDSPGATTTTSAALTASTAQTTSANATMARPATTVSAASAVMRVTTERCDRASTCKQVGIGAKYGDRDECVNAVGHDVVATLPDEDCALGVPADRLEACLSEVRSNSCDGGADSTTRLAACARERLCAGGSGAARAADASPQAPAKTEVDTEAGSAAPATPSPAQTER